MSDFRPLFRTSCLILAAWTAAASGQLVVPPGPAPAPTPKVAPPPPPAPPQAARPVVEEELPPVDYQPITPRDSAGNPMELQLPQDFVALGHNPWIDAAMLARAATTLQARRLEIEQAVIDNLDGVERLLTPEFRQLELVPNDPRSGERLALLQASLRPFIDLGPLTKPLVESGAVPKRVETLHARITNAYQKDMMTRITSDRETYPDVNNGIIQFMTRTSTAEILYFYDRLVIDAAAGLPQWMGELGIAGPAAEALAAARATFERAEPGAKADAARAVLAPLSVDLRKRALQKALLARSAPAATAIPGAEVSFRPLTVEERSRAVFAILEGQAFDWKPFVTSAGSGG